MPVEEGSLLVDSDSPLWMHEEVLKRARAFRFEFGYDRVQWEGSASKAGPPEWRGHLFISDDGAIAGACGFYAEDEVSWELHWIWLAPPYRRHGLVKAAWPALISRYGDFDLERPIQDAMYAFIAKHGSPRQVERHRKPIQ
ncbi:GNAT family N-acetyltransferase [Pseudomonas sp. MWU13-3659]|uniref:GNAT family N-acetyltransferase n=1 Tax=Pseudomonas sp. MWU13-3659 TaxID=2986964 RepID=UPI0020756D93|nr:GNAT family N-acetyltransferase [Pseudomonas sp. MWU13-3659]